MKHARGLLSHRESFVVGGIERAHTQYILPRLPTSLFRLDTSGSVNSTLYITFAPLQPFTMANYIIYHQDVLANKSIGHFPTLHGDYPGSSQDDAIWVSSDDESRYDEDDKSDIDFPPAHELTVEDLSKYGRTASAGMYLQSISYGNFRN